MTVKDLDSIHKPWAVIAQFGNLLLREPLNLIILASRPSSIHHAEIEPHDRIDGTSPGHHGKRDGMAANEAGAFVLRIQLSGKLE